MLLKSTDEGSTEAYYRWDRIFVLVMVLIVVLIVDAGLVKKKLALGDAPIERGTVVAVETPADAPHICGGRGGTDEGSSGRTKRAAVQVHLHVAEPAPGLAADLTDWSCGRPSVGQVMTVVRTDGEVLIDPWAAHSWWLTLAGGPLVGLVILLIVAAIVSENPISRWWRSRRRVGGDH